MIKLRPLARREIRSITAFLDQQSLNPRLRARFLASFENTCLLLENSPEIGVIILPEAFAPLRRFPIENYPKILIFYRHTKSAIVVERVIHGARDWTNTIHETFRT